METRVLALDLATVTGWALHEPGMERPYFGAIKLPGKPGDIGMRADALERWLRHQYQLRRFTHIVFEAQHVAAALNMDTVNMLIGLGTIVQKFAFQVKALCYNVDKSEWRKHFIGRGSGFKRYVLPNGKKGNYLPGQDPKELAIRQCARYGWHTDVADAAEACGILDYFLTMVPDHPRPWRDAVLLKGVG